MNRTTFSMNNCNKETISVWLVSILQFAFDISFFKPFETFSLKMKEVRYIVSYSEIAYGFSFHYYGL